MKNRTGEKIKLASIDELLGVVNEESAMEIEVDKIKEFKDHPFKVSDDEKMKDLVESIKKTGIITPVLLREKSVDEYEMISGHRRMHAAIKVGLKTIPAIVREMTDDEAIIAMVDANIQREELLPSEKAFAYKMKYNAIKRQGRRTDLASDQKESKLKETTSDQKELKLKETTSDQKELKLKDITSDQNGFKLTSEAIGEMEGISGTQVKRYIRLTELIPELLEMVDQRKMQFTVAVEVSYLNNEMQQWVYEYIKENGFLKLSQVTALRKRLETEKVNHNYMIAIFQNVITGKKSKRKLILQENKLMKYFPVDYSEKDVENVVISLLEEWKDKNTEV